jgi:hypothetical protein
MALFAIRAVPHLVTGKAKFRRSLTLDDFVENGFVLLAEQVGKEVVLGAIGKFWRPDSGISRVDASEFQSFDDPGYAKAAMNFRVDELGPDRCLLVTETRVLCTDASSRRKFRLYWSAIGPFSGAIRHVMLRQAKRSAESASLALG